jgi:hypothetical protein
MSDFGRVDPRQMPVHLFYGSLRVDYGTAVKADVERQNCSICPRYWYIDAVFRCSRCDAEFTFSAAEQRVWYEDYGFWIDSLPTRCPDCRRALRELKAIRREYDHRVAEVLQSGTLEAKRHLASLIDQMYELGGELPPGINATRRRLANELSKAD